jgi:SagB-type dehydrogenase family enzyme
VRFALALLAAALVADPGAAQVRSSRVDLPRVAPSRDATLASLLEQRHSVREFSDRSLELAEVAQVLWAAMGLNRPDGRRTVPSAGALFPLDVYVVAGDVRGLAPGVYRYVPHEHALEPTAAGDRRTPLVRAALRQEWAARAPAIVVVTAEYERTTVKYGDRGVRYAHMEVGGVAQNVYLQCAALNLGTTFVGAFDDEKVGAVLELPAAHRPLALLPVGTPGTR